MKLLDKISTFNKKIGIISTFIVLLTGAGLIPLTKSTINFIQNKSLYSQ